LKSNDSARNLVFRLRNPRGVPARKFALRAEKKHSVIFCQLECNPAFRQVEIYVSTIATQTQTVSPALELAGVTAQTRTAPPTRFHEPQYFTAKQIDFFETADYTAIQADLEPCRLGICFQRE
jgi:hypothetical protein